MRPRILLHYPEYYTPFQLSPPVKKGYYENECFGLGSLSRFYMILNTLDLECFFLENYLVIKIIAASKNAFQNMGAERFQQMITDKKVSIQILLKNDVELKHY